MNRQALRERIALDECVGGKPNLTAYRDSRGLWTIGYGHLLHNDPTVGVPRISKITPEEAEALFDVDLVMAERRVISIIGESAYDNLDDVRQRVLVNMAFNLGDGLAEFKHLLAAVSAGDWTEAGKEMEASAWWGQVGARAERLRSMMEAGAGSEFA